MSGNFIQVLLYLHLLPKAGLFKIKFNGYRIWEVKKKNFDGLTNTCKTGSGKGKQKYV